MLALTLACACRVHAPAEPCAEVMLGACIERTAALTTCERGRARDLDDGGCMPTRDTRELARATGVFVDEHDAIECEAKSDELVASTRLGKIACIAHAPPPLLPSCPPRTVRQAEACAPLDHAGAVDVATWSRAAAAEVCRRLLRSPLGIATTETSLEVELRASVPNNDLTLAFVRAATKPASADADLARALGPVDDALRRLGGIATSTDMTATAICRTTSRRPISVP
jgi:hypothetical protein